MDSSCPGTPVGNSQLQITRFKCTVEDPEPTPNGLRVEKCKAHSVFLRWEDTNPIKVRPRIYLHNVSPEMRVFAPHAYYRPLHEAGYEQERLAIYEIQMTRTGEEKWDTIYRGYSQNFQIHGLKSETNFSFRMRRNCERLWGAPVVAITQNPPPNAEDLHRAIRRNKEKPVYRVIANSCPLYVKKLLSTHDRSGQTALMTAALNGNVDIMTILLKAGSEVNAKALNTSKTALMFACFNGSMDCILLLEKAGAEWEPRDSTGCNAVHHAVNGESVEILEYAIHQRGVEAIDEKDLTGWTPLLRAVILGTSVEVINILLRNGANPNAKDAKNTKSCLFASVMLNKPAFITALLQHRADPKYKNMEGQTALNLAESLKYEGIVSMLRRAMGRPDKKVVEAKEAAKAAVRPRVLTGQYESKVIPDEAGLSPSEYILELQEKVSLLRIHREATKLNMFEHLQRIKRIKENNPVLPEVRKTILPKGYSGPLPSRCVFHVKLDDPNEKDHVFVDVPEFGLHTLLACRDAQMKKPRPRLPMPPGDNDYEELVAGFKSFSFDWNFGKPTKKPMKVMKPIKPKPPVYKSLNYSSPVWSDDDISPPVTRRKSRKSRRSTKSQRSTTSHPRKLKSTKKFAAKTPSHSTAASRRTSQSTRALSTPRFLSSQANSEFDKPKTARASSRMSTKSLMAKKTPASSTTSRATSQSKSIRSLSAPKTLLNKANTNKPMPAEISPRTPKNTLVTKKPPTQSAASRGAFQSKSTWSPSAPKSPLNQSNSNKPVPARASRKSMRLKL